MSEKSISLDQQGQAFAASSASSGLHARTRPPDELLRELSERVAALEGRPAGPEDRLSLIVFSGSLDRLMAAFILSTGAAAMGMRVDMFFTFWATAALRKESANVDKTLIERMFGWMLPRGPRRLPLSQMNIAGGGPAMIRYLMKKKGVASVEELIILAGELGVRINVCSMSMDLLGVKEAEIIDYPGLAYCGVASFLESSAPGKLTMFL